MGRRYQLQKLVFKKPQKMLADTKMFRAFTLICYHLRTLKTKWFLLSAMGLVP